MFGRSTPADPKPAPQPAPTAQPAAPAPQQTASPSPAPAPAPAASAQMSVIGSDLAIVGQKIHVVSQGRVQIDGQIEGDVAGREVIIGQSGGINGTVTANSVEVRGSVHGAINAAAVALQSSSQVEGDINHQTLVIAEGAQFDGRVRRPQDAGSLEPNLDVSSISAAVKS